MVVSYEVIGCYESGQQCEEAQIIVEGQKASVPLACVLCDQI